MALVVVEWSVVVLAAYGLMALWRSELSMRRLMWSILSATGILFMLIIVMGAMTDYGASNLDSVADTWWGAQIQDIVSEQRREIFMKDAWRAVLYVSITAIALLGYAWFKNQDLKHEMVRKALPYAMIFIVGYLMVNDLTDVNDRYFGEDKWQEKREIKISPSDANKEILKDKELGFRVFDLVHAQSAHASNFHRSVDGYHGAKLGRYNEVLNKYIYGFYDEYVTNKDISLENINVLAMLNVKYLIIGKQLYGNPSLGAAWLVESPKQMGSAKEAFEAIGHEDLGKYAIVEPSAPELKDSYDTSGSIRLVEYAPNYLKYEYDSAEEALAVFSEIYYEDGWTAYIDGKEADYFCVDYILRGMELPAGKHTIEWEFRAPNWGVATAITGIGSWLILIALIVVATAPLSRKYLLP
jgi:hypothetical protein